MNTNIIERRYNYHLRQSLNGTNGQFTKTINIPFIPDEMIVRTIQYYNNGGEAGISFISQNITPFSDVISSFGDGLALSLQSVYTLNKPVYGLFTFTITDSTGALVTTRAGVLTLIIEFVKYKEQKPEKIY